MAFKLNVRGTYRHAARPLSTAERMFGARQQIRLGINSAYLESPRMHVMTAALMFMAGLSLATFQSRMGVAHSYDMTPTGSIVARATPGDPTHRTCQ